MSIEYDASVYGVPTLGVCTPLFNEETGEVIGTFGMLIPKVAAVSLREMSKNLGDSLLQISSTIEELASSASNIHSNEQNLNESIHQITKTKKINDNILIYKINQQMKQNAMLKGSYRSCKSWC
jgi:methyl-accepting chemotaxis protein